MEGANETLRTCDDVRNRILRHGSEFWRTMLQIRGRATIFKNHSSLQVRPDLLNLLTGKS